MINIKIIFFLIFLVRNANSTLIEDNTCHSLQNSTVYYCSLNVYQNHSIHINNTYNYYFNVDDGVSDYHYLSMKIHFDILNSTDLINDSCKIITDYGDQTCDKNCEVDYTGNITVPKNYGINLSIQCSYESDIFFSMIVKYTYEKSNHNKIQYWLISFYFFWAIFLSLCISYILLKLLRNQYEYIRASDLLNRRFLGGTSLIYPKSSSNINPC